MSPDACVGFLTNDEIGVLRGSELSHTPNASLITQLRIHIMSHSLSTDNVYPEGTVITAKASPWLKLKIVKYFQRIYYCAVINDDSKKQFAYFERELIAPVLPLGPHFAIAAVGR